MLQAAVHAATMDVEKVRGTMTGHPLNFSPSADLHETFSTWRRIQVRQLFRLSLEALLFWIAQQLLSGPKGTAALVEEYVRQSESSVGQKLGKWLALPTSVEQGPLDLIERIMRAFGTEPYEGLAKAIANGVRLSLAEAPDRGEPFERVDRMPLFRARREAEARIDEPVEDFVRHVIESWVLAQHTYWSVGRGLADARSRGKTILRLKVVLEEGGWSLAPGGAFMKPPQPTPDRLQTALALANECGFIQVSAHA